MSSFRLAVLKIDRSTVLPLRYEYNEAISSYCTLGHVRLSSVMLPEVTYLGRDTPAVRDAFLTEVLLGLTIPEGQARRIVRDAEHPGAAETAAGVPPAREGRAPLDQSARNDTWELARMPEKEDFWRLTNISDQPLFPASARFSRPRDGRTWTDEVSLGITVPILNPGGSTQMHIAGADQVTSVVVRWRSGRSRFSRLREWEVRF